MGDNKPSRQDEAAAWFAALRAGVMLAEDRAAFDAWRADPRNQAALDAMHELWGELAILKGAQPTSREGRRAGRATIAAATAIAIVSLAGVGWFTLSRDTTIQTMEGQQATQSLPDGSILAVNVATRVSYRFEDTQRIVKIADGEAAFKVKANTEKPFVVRTGDYEVRATGTAFNVRQRDGAIEVAVSEGAVQICAASGPNRGSVLADLLAGQQLRFPAALSSTPLAKPTPVPPAQVSEWRMRIVTYEDATVGTVVDDLNRYFDRKLLVEDSALRDRRVTVRLQVDDHDRAIDTLAALLDGEVVKTEKGLILRD